MTLRAEYRVSRSAGNTVYNLDDYSCVGDVSVFFCTEDNSHIHDHLQPNVNYHAPLGLHPAVADALLLHCSVKILCALAQVNRRWRHKVGGEVVWKSLWARLPPFLRERESILGLSNCSTPCSR